MPDPSASPSITRDQAVLIGSRLFACYVLFWVADDILALPREILSITHELQGPNAIGYSALSAFKASYWVRSYILNLASNVLWIALLLMVAGWFYRCGPRIRNFFTAEDNNSIQDVIGREP